jgi:hypothetical protein
VRSGLDTLIGDFLAELQVRNARSNASNPQGRVEPGVGPVTDAEQPNATWLRLSLARHLFTAERMAIVSIVYFSLYIIACLSVLVYWQCRGRSSRLGLR